jgi:hypothetical protein
MDSQLINLYVGYRIGGIVFSILSLVTCGLLLYGVSRKRPGFYWPYLIFMV